MELKKNIYKKWLKPTCRDATKVENLVSQPVSGKSRGFQTQLVVVESWMSLSLSLCRG